MARRKKGDAHAGGHGWYVTFADLMGLLMAFFVVVAASSSQDKEKMATAIGSIREAFGVEQVPSKAGIIEREGTPIREFFRTVSPVPRNKDAEFAETSHDKRRKQGPEANTHDIERNDIERPRHFAVAAASLRQAWREMPELMELSKNILVEETPEGLQIQLVDQEGRSMFPSGGAEPYERTRKLLAAMAPVLKRLPNRIRITGHTDASRMYERPGYTLWDLSADRAMAARRILAENGLPHEHFYSVEGRADAEPLFPDDPFLASNRRISILVMAEAPPYPIANEP